MMCTRRSAGADRGGSTLRTGRSGFTKASNRNVILMAESEHYYTAKELCELLDRAEQLGFSLEAGSELENMTVAELERLVTNIQ